MSSYDGFGFEYPPAYHAEEDPPAYYAEADIRPQQWADQRRIRYTVPPRMTVDPSQLSQWSGTYEQPRQHVTEPRYHNSRRHGPTTVIVSQPDMPRSSGEGRHFSSEYEVQQPHYQRPQIQIEVHAQPSKSKRYYCDVENCIDPDTGYRRSVSRRADLARHMKTMHASPTIDCEYKRCPRRGEDGFRRIDHYREHLRGYHNQEVPRTEKRRNS